MHPPPLPRSACSARCSAGARMFIPVGSRAARPAGAGYQPACANEWVRGICDKPRIKCSNARTGASCRSPTRSSAGICPARTIRDANSSWASIRCSRTKPAISWPSISTASLAGGCRGVAGDLPAAGAAGRSGALALGQRRARLVVFRRGRSRQLAREAGLVHPDRNDGAPPGNRPGFL